MTLIKVITPEQIEQLANLAREIQLEHFTPITGRAQVEYMLDRFQSPEAISEQILHENYTYYLLTEDGQPFGYVGFYPKERSLFLSKFYIRKNMRNLGYGRETLDFIVELCKEEGLQSIWLTVNRKNFVSIEKYKRMGFTIECSQKRDLGDGFVADDYFMRKEVE